MTPCRNDPHVATNLTHGLNEPGKDDDNNEMASTSKICWICINCATCTSISYPDAGL